MSDTRLGPGRFSWTYEAERRCVPLRDWPEPDRLAFEAARKPGDTFELPGLAASWAPSTCRARIQAYGRYLGFLSRRGLLLDTEGIADRLTPERLGLYLAEARGFLAPGTIVQMTRELRLVISALAPEQDWGWITEHPARPRNREVRAARKPVATFDPRIVCSKAIDLMDHLDAGPVTFELAILYRNALITAFQCVFALRRRNLVGMTLGRNLVIDGDTIHLMFAADETKNDSPISTTVPDLLKPYVSIYIGKYRPILLGNRKCDAVWINGRHGALEYGAVPGLLSSTGRLLIGRALTCHCFRHSVATAILEKDPRRIRMASGQLGHRSLRTVNLHYDLSGQGSSRKVWNKLRSEIIRGKHIGT